LVLSGTAGLDAVTETSPGEANGEQAAFLQCF
jgi:hypothetical protein